MSSEIREATWADAMAAVRQWEEAEAARGAARRTGEELTLREAYTYRPGATDERWRDAPSLAELLTREPANLILMHEALHAELSRIETAIRIQHAEYERAARRQR